MTNLRTHDSTPSYVGPRGSSTIDHLFLRQAQCDRDARQARCIPTFPLLQAREYPDHRPVVCSVRKDWQVWVHNKKEETKVLASKHAKALTHAAQANMPSWNNFLDQAALSLQNPLMHDPDQVTSNILSLSTRATCRLDPNCRILQQMQIIHQEFGDRLSCSKHYQTWFP